VELIKAHGLEKGCSKEKGALVMIVGSTFPVAAIRAAGVGIVVSDTEIEEAVAQVLQDNVEALEADRYHFNTMKLLQPIKSIGNMAWADIAKVKAELATQTEAILGPKTAADEKPREKPKKVKAPKSAKVPQPPHRTPINRLSVQSVHLVIVQ